MNVWHPYTNARLTPEPIEIVRGKGAWLIAADGTRYLDAISSWWTNIHGHGHPRLAAALADQARRLEHVIFAGFTHAPAEKLATKLCDLLSMQRIFYSDNGSTAVEAALKIAAQYWRNRGEPRTQFLKLPGGYHGDTVGAMSVSSIALFRETFGSMLFHVDEYDGVVDREIAAVIVEPMVQGAAGMRMHDVQFLQELEERCRASGALLIADEVMTGFGRTGRMFAFEHAALSPDIVCLSKGLTGGTLPFAATAVREHVYEVFDTDDPQTTFFHGHSYTGNPLGCAVALESLRLFEESDLLERARTIGNRISVFLQELQGHPQVKDVRGLGCIQAVELAGQDGYLADVGTRLRAAALNRGVLLRPLGNVLYAMPPYCVTNDEADQIGTVMRDLVLML